MYKYQIKIKLSSDSAYLTDTIQFVVFRCPVFKQMSFSILTTHMPSATIAIVEGELSRGIMPIVDVVCEQILENKSSNNTTVIQNLIFKKHYLIYYAKVRGTGVTETRSIDDPLAVDLFLANPTLYFLNANNFFKRSFIGLTARQMITKYEEFINDELKLNFKFDYNLGASDNISSYIYQDEILITGKNDLYVLGNILNKYKVTLSPCLYFFDDFVYSNNAVDDITVSIFNIGQHNMFDKVNLIDDHAIIFDTTRQVKNDLINDASSELFKPKATIIGHIGTDIANIETSFGTDVKMPVVRKSTSQQIQLEKGVLFQNIKTILQSNTIPPSIAKNQSITIEAPDDIFLSKNRYDTMVNLIIGDIGSIVTYESSDVGINIFQFGKTYNMYSPIEKLYSYTPINIINQFIKTSAQSESDTAGPILQHNTTYQMISYNDL